MKKLFFSLLALCLPMALAAQIPRGVYLELLGGSTMAGVTYDARFNDHTHWGWRAGLSFAYSDVSGFLRGNSNARYWAVPVGVNYLIGSRKNNLELGLGASLGVVNQHTTEWSIRSVDITMDEYNRYVSDPSLLPSNASTGVQFDDDGNGQAWMTYVDSRNKKENGFGYYFFGDIGYRHVANSGFLFRCGLNPMFNFGGKHAICRTFGDTFRKFSLGLYLGFGWAF